MVGQEVGGFKHEVKKHMATIVAGCRNHWPTQDGHAFLFSFLPMGLENTFFTSPHSQSPSLRKTNIVIVKVGRARHLSQVSSLYLEQKGDILHIVQSMYCICLTLAVYYNCLPIARYM